MSNELITRASEIIKSRTLQGGGDYSQFYSTLALIDLDGYPAATTMSISKPDGIRQLFFTTSLDSNVVKRIQKCSRAAVCVNSAEYHISLTGNIEVLTDPQTKQEMWYNELSHYFTGASDPNFCVLRFNTERYNLFIDDKEAVGTI